MRTLYSVGKEKVVKCYLLSLLSNGVCFIWLFIIIIISKCSSTSLVLFSQNDDEGSDFDLPPSWVAPIEISLKGDSSASCI